MIHAKGHLISANPARNFFKAILFFNCSNVFSVTKKIVHGHSSDLVTFVNAGICSLLKSTVFPHLVFRFPLNSAIARFRSKAKKNIFFHDEENAKKCSASRDLGKIKNQLICTFPSHFTQSVSESRR